MIHWNASPEIFTLGPLKLRWYGLLFASGFALGFQVVKKFFINEKVSTFFLDPLVFYLMVGTVIGARLGHCLFYEPQIYLADPIRILKVWEGGLASHGAAIGCFISVWIFTKRYSQFKYLWLVDRICVAATVAGAMIRLGNLFNSEIIGKAATVPWAFVFERIDDVPRHPTQLYESFAYLIIFGMMQRVYWKTKLKDAPGFLFGFYLFCTFIARAGIEFFKEPQVSFEAKLPIDMGQILSIPMILAGIGFMVWAVSNSKKAAKKA
jgi:phosphatidylglycerol:prolipoprotein diacylglycerol transferase